jgi:hypothetical protein
MTIRERAKGAASSLISFFAESKNESDQAIADQAALKGKLQAASGLDGVVDVLIQEKKSKKEKAERKNMENQVLSL